MLGVLEGEHILANIQHNHPINSCIHCGHFLSLFRKFLESFGARQRVKAKAGKKGSFYSNINEISSRQPPSVLCICLQWRPRLKIKHKDGTKEKTHTAKRSTEGIIKNGGCLFCISPACTFTAGPKKQ